MRLSSLAALAVTCLALCPVFAPAMDYTPGNPPTPTAVNYCPCDAGCNCVASGGVCACDCAAQTQFVQFRQDCPNGVCSPLQFDSRAVPRSYALAPTLNYAPGASGSQNVAFAPHAQSYAIQTEVSETGGRLFGNASGEVGPVRRVLGAPIRLLKRAFGGGARGRAGCG